MSYLEVTLERDGFNQPWGLRMMGGVDVGSPLTVSRVIAGTASEGVLRVGDVITGIKGQDATQLTHQEASDLFKKAGNVINLVIARGVVNGSPGTPVSPRVSTVDGPFGSGQRKPAQVGRPPARKFSDTVQTPTSYLPTTTFVKPKSPLEAQVEQALEEEYHEKEMIVEQPYRTNPLITPGAKVKRDTPIVASYLRMHPDPQVRGAAPHVSQVSSGLSSMLGSANEQLARKVATNVRSAAGDRTDRSGPRIIHHQFNTPANLYSSENMANSIQQQTGISPQVSGPKKEFSIQNSETLRMILEEDQARPPTQHKPKSHVVYDVHEAKRGVWPPPDLQERRTIPPPGERPVRTSVEEQKHDLPDAPTTNQPPSMFTNSEKIAQSYSFNKLMWTVGTN